MHKCDVHDRLKFMLYILQNVRKVNKSVRA